MRRLLLAGAGHAHLQVLRAFRAAPPPDTEITLVTPFPRQVYSGMLPGWIAGHYTLEQCVIPLAPIVRGSAIRVRLAHVARLDLAARVAWTETAEPIPFDLLSIDTGSVANDTLPGHTEHGIAVRPIEHFIAVWQRLHAQYAANAIDGGDPATLTVIGGGAGGVEIALAIAWRAQTSNLGVRVQLVAGGDGLLPTFPESARRRVARWLPEYRVRLIEDDVVELGRGTVLLADGGELGSDAAIVATGAAAADWPRASGLAVDGRGFIGVNDRLQSLSHPFVFAAGDCASMIDHPRPKSGVYAVRAGPALEQNLRRALAGRPLRRHRPQAKALYLLALGGRRALGVRGRWVVEGDWAWLWKDWIDRRFVRSFAPDGNGGGGAAATAGPGAPPRPDR